MRHPTFIPGGRECTYQVTGRAGARLALALAFAALAAVFTVIPSAAHGATPASGTLTDTSGPINYTAGPFAVGEPNARSRSWTTDRSAQNPVQPCDDFALTVSLPSDYAGDAPARRDPLHDGLDGHGYRSVRLRHLRVQGNRSRTRTARRRRTRGDRVAGTLRSPLSRSSDGTQTFTVKVVPFQPTAETVSRHHRARDRRGQRWWWRRRRPRHSAARRRPSRACPRYQILSAPSESGANSTTGEFNIGFNPKTGNIMTNSWGDVFRVTPPEKRTPALPEAGPALWQDVSPSLASADDAGSDPRHRPVDRPHVRRRTATTGAERALRLHRRRRRQLDTDVRAPASNGGVDHQTHRRRAVPGAAGSALNGIYPNAVYYCSQADRRRHVRSAPTAAACTFGPGRPGLQRLTECGGLHGHIKVAPDGTVYLPNKTCGSERGRSAVSDRQPARRGTSSPVPGTARRPDADPSIGDRQGRHGRTSATTAARRLTRMSPSATTAGQTWTDDQRHRRVRSVSSGRRVPRGGRRDDPSRAACGFLGTTDKAGDYQDADDLPRPLVPLHRHHLRRRLRRGRRSTPRRTTRSRALACICPGGTTLRRRTATCSTSTRSRSTTRAACSYGYDDGCVTQTCIQRWRCEQRLRRVRRRSHARPAASRCTRSYDPTEPATPKAPYLDGHPLQRPRQILNWNAPDNGGSDFTAYRILRGTSPGSETQIATVARQRRHQYVDAAVNSSSVAEYYYKVVAVNGAGRRPGVERARAHGERRSAGAAEPVQGSGPDDPDRCERGQPDGNTGHRPQVAAALRSRTMSDGSLKLRFELDTDPGH